MKRIKIGWSDGAYNFCETDLPLYAPGFSVIDVPDELIDAWRCIDDLNAVIQEQLRLLDNEGQGEGPVSRNNLIQLLKTAAEAFTTRVFDGLLAGAPPLGS
jgi:hypothetical protein